MFIWVEGPKGVDMDAVYLKAVERKAAFVPGRYFFTQPGEGRETMRLNFTKADEGAIDRAIQVLSEEIQGEMDQLGRRSKSFCNI